MSEYGPHAHSPLRKARGYRSVAENGRWVLGCLHGKRAVGDTIGFLFVCLLFCFLCAWIFLLFCRSQFQGNLELLKHCVLNPVHIHEFKFKNQYNLAEATMLLILTDFWGSLVLIFLVLEFGVKITWKSKKLHCLLFLILQDRGSDTFLILEQ